MDKIRSGYLSKWMITDDNRKKSRQDFIKTNFNFTYEDSKSTYDSQGCNIYFEVAFNGDIFDVNDKPKGYIVTCTDYDSCSDLIITSTKANLDKIRLVYGELSDIHKYINGNVFNKDCTIGIDHRSLDDSFNIAGSIDYGNIPSCMRMLEFIIYVYSDQM